MQDSDYQSNTVALPVPTTVDIQKLRIYAMKTCNPKNPTLLKGWICRSNMCRYLSLDGGLKLMPEHMVGENGSDLVVGTW
jgi:hypothetical protein